MADLPDDSMKRLAKYWFRAKLMHELMHSMKDEYGLVRIEKEGLWWEFETFLVHWLSGLFVVVEGFNKLKLRDARVQRLFKEHMQHLKRMRHETYHFVSKVEPDTSLVIRQVNWAEELHAAIGDFIREEVLRRAEEERPKKKKRVVRKKTAKTP
jgi:hypothetical protein